MTQILFIDDDPFILQAIKRLLMFSGEDWEPEFAATGDEALRLCGERRFDVVVSDLQMPGMDGAELLTRISETYPDIIRIILSGQSDAENLYRVIGPAHQYLAKPCDLRVLEASLIRACKLKQRMNKVAEISRVVTCIQSLPPLPTHVAKVMSLLASPTSSVEEIGEVIARDAAMSSRVLQLVNSAFFGSPTPITHIPKAVSFLGMDRLRPLVLSAGIFSSVNSQRIDQQKLGRILNVGSATGVLASQIARYETDNPEIADQSMAAGLLKDVGLIILLSHFPNQLNETLALCRDEDVSLAEAESQILGANHGEIGAYLLSLWGLPCRVVEAVAFHQTPDESIDTQFGPLVAIHAAGAQCPEQLFEGFDSRVELDMEFLKRCELADHVEAWQSTSLSTEFA